MKVPVSSSYHKIDEERPEQRLLARAQVSVHRELHSDVQRRQKPSRRHGRDLQGAGGSGGAHRPGICLDLGGDHYWAARRFTWGCSGSCAAPATLLQSQQQQLISNETFVALGRNVLGGRPQPAQPVGHHPLQRRTGPGGRQPRMRSSKTSATSSARSTACRAGSASCWCRCGRRTTTARPWICWLALEDTLGAFDALIQAAAASRCGSTRNRARRSSASRCC
jgi:hypothetical protein